MKLKSLIHLILIVFPISITFNAIHVMASVGVIKVPEDYALIQWAINAASSGDTILVSRNSQEQVIVNKSITLIGDGAGVGVDSIIIEANGVKIMGFNGLGEVNISGNGETITNTTIHGGITISGNDNVIKGNRIIIQDYYGTGITLNSGECNLIDNNLITNLGAYKLRTGIYISSTAKQNLFFNNTIHRNYWGLHIEMTTVALFGPRNNTLYHNNFVGNFEPVWEPWMADDNNVNYNYWDKKPDIPNIVVLGHPWDIIPPQANVSVSYDQDGRNPLIDGIAVEDTPVWMHGRNSSDNYFITHYKWGFGDGTNETGTGVDPWYAMWETSHIYSEPGIYNVSLTVWDLGENNDTVSTTITVLRDTDGDGTADVDDPDDDGDGILDLGDAFPLDASEWLDTDGDRIGDNADSDDDNDGMPDWWETEYGLNSLNASDGDLDLDGDGLSNLQEYERGSNPKFPHSEPLLQFPPWLIGVAGVAIGSLVIVGIFLWKRRQTLRKREVEFSILETFNHAFHVRDCFRPEPALYCTW